MSESLTTAEIVTVSPPLPTWTELAITSTLFAELVHEALDAAPLEQPPPPNGGVPAFAVTAAAGDKRTRHKRRHPDQALHESIPLVFGWVRTGAQRAAVRSVTTLGVRKISSSVFDVVRVFVLNR